EQSRRTFENLESVLMTLDIQLQEEQRVQEHIQGIKTRGKGRFKGKCNFCKKVGHKEAQCWEKEKASGTNGQDKKSMATGTKRGQKSNACRVRTSMASAVRDVDQCESQVGNADSGASDHFVNDDRLFARSERCAPIQVE